MKLAITGIRGIPANYGGFETFAENLSVRLAEKGHDVTVYGRGNNITTKERRYKGVNLVILPAINRKYLDTVSHTFLAVGHAAFVGKYDIILICNAANAVFSGYPRLFGKKTVLNVDGIERERKKWNNLGKSYYRLSEWLATFMPNALVTDAQVIKDYYLERHRKDSFMIPYGASVSRKLEGSPLISKYGLKPNGYVLYVSRLEPENNADMVIEAFGKIKTSMPLAIVGDAPYAKDYITRLKSTKDRRVKFLGAVYGEGYRVLQQNAFCYVQASEVGGTHPALLEAMGFGNCVLALDRPEHLEVAGDAALYFDSTDELINKLNLILVQPGVAGKYAKRAAERIRDNYSWEKVTDLYENLFKSLISHETTALSDTAT